MGGDVGLLEALATTRAIRRYTDAPVGDADLEQILWHAGRAPSGSNRQPFRFLVLRDGPKPLPGFSGGAAQSASPAPPGRTRGHGTLRNRAR